MENLNGMLFRHDDKGKVNIIIVVIIMVILLALSSVGIFAFAAMFLIGREIDSDNGYDASEFDTAVTAVITENRRVDSSTGKGVKSRPADSYIPVYQYEYNGKVYTELGNVASAEPHYSVGDEVIVNISSDHPDEMYDPDYNVQTEYKDFRDMVFKLKIFPAIFAVIVFIITTVAVIVAVRGSVRRDIKD